MASSVDVLVLNKLVRFQAGRDVVCDVLEIKFLIAYHSNDGECHVGFTSYTSNFKTFSKLAI